MPKICYTVWSDEIIAGVGVSHWRSEMESSPKRVGVILMFSCFMIVSFASCASSKKALPKGSCLTNENCEKGNRCVNGECEDIYHRRKDIKNY